MRLYDSNLHIKISIKVCTSYRATDLKVNN